jgi:hypothetical protein
LIAMQHEQNQDDEGARDAADATLQRALDELGLRVRAEAEGGGAEIGSADAGGSAGAALAGGPYDDRDYHALAHGFHAARRDMLDAERPAAALHRFPGAGTSSVPTGFRSPRLTLWGGLAAIAAGLALLAWSAFGSGASASAPFAGEDFAGENVALGHLRGGDETLSLRLERDAAGLHFVWSGKRVLAGAKHTLRIYPAGSLRAVLVRAGLSGDRESVSASELPAGAYEAEVELATETGVAPASPRVSFTR